MVLVVAGHAYGWRNGGQPLQYVASLDAAPERL